MDVTSSSSSRTILNSNISNSLYDDHLEDTALSAEKKAEAAVAEAKANYAKAVSQERILDNKVIKIRLLNSDNQKVYTYGIGWFGLNKNQEVLVGQHIKFDSSIHTNNALKSNLPPELKNHLDEEYVVVEVIPVYRDDKEAEAVKCEAKEAEAVKCEAKEAEAVKCEAEAVKCVAKEAEAVKCEAEAVKCVAEEVECEAKR